MVQFEEYEPLNQSNRNGGQSINRFSFSKTINFANFNGLLSSGKAGYYREFGEGYDESRVQEITPTMLQLQDQQPGVHPAYESMGTGRSATLPPAEPSEPD